MAEATKIVLTLRLGATTQNFTPGMSAQFFTPKS
jgi:hypothetical protein